MKINHIFSDNKLTNDVFLSTNHKLKKQKMNISVSAEPNKTHHLQNSPLYSTQTNKIAIRNTVQ